MSERRQRAALEEAVARLLGSCPHVLHLDRDRGEVREPQRRARGEVAALQGRLELERLEQEPARGGEALT